jgi:AraC-like DNA-binding protein
MSDSEKYASAWLMNVFLSYAASLGFEPEEILRTTELQADAQSTGGQRVSFSRLTAAADTIAARTGAPLSGLSLAADAVRLYGQNNILMMIMANCPNLGDAIRKLALYHDISTNSVRLALSRHGDGGGVLRLRVNFAVPPELKSLLIEAAVASCALMFRQITQDRVRFVQVCLAHSPLRDPSEYRLFFGCPVSFHNEDDQIEFDAPSLSLPIALSNPALLGVLEQYAETTLQNVTDCSMPLRVKNILREMLVTGNDFSIFSVSNKLNVGSRTLQKLLKRDGTTYTALLDEVRKTLALQALKDNSASLTDIAFLLGFSEQSAFNHAFRRWTGVSPKEHVERHANNAELQTVRK